MRFKSIHISFVLVLFVFSGFFTPSSAQKLPSRAGKQCKILVQNLRAKKSNKKVKIRGEKPVRKEQETLQARIMTNEEYDQLVEEVQNNLPEYDVMNDCPPSFRKTAKKKFRLKDLFKRNNRSRKWK